MGLALISGVISINVFNILAIVFSKCYDCFRKRRQRRIKLKEEFYKTSRIEASFKESSISSQNSFGSHMTPIKRERYRSFFRAPGMAELGWGDPSKGREAQERKPGITRLKLVGLSEKN